MASFNQLSARDRMVLQSWLRTNVSLDDVMASHSTGLVGNCRYSDAARQAYVLLWTWSAERFHGDAGLKQDGFYQRFGRDRLLKRIERCQRLIRREIS